MNYARQVSRQLDEEHHAQLALMNRLEHLLNGRDAVLPAAMASELVRTLELDIGRHFGFEETELFPRLEEFGAGDIGRLLRAEHDDLRALATEMLPLLRAAGAGDVPLGAALRQLGAELVERQISHIQKETMGLLPLVDDLLDEATDRQLAMAYADA
jgi:hemerythrin-like domain-containing protein